jgi:type VI secretion system protein ImpG
MMNAAGTDELLDYYQRELDYVRNAGRDFARRHPQAARRLELGPMESPDPHVERLIEAFAFLTGRVRRELDSEFPEIAGALLETMLPHFTAPLPSMTIVQMELDPTKGLASAGRSIARDTALHAAARRLAGSSEEIGCQFRTCYPLTLWPLEVSYAGLEPAGLHRGLEDRPGVGSVLRLRLRCTVGAMFGKGEGAIAPARLRLHLSGGWEVAGRLYELLLARVGEVRMVAPGDDCADAVRGAAFGWKEVGYAADEAVLPAAGQAHPAYRLLQEYFAYPGKFLFFDADGLDAGFKALGGRSVDLLLLLDGQAPDRLQVQAENFLLGCTPAINLFPRTSETLRLDQRQVEYRLSPDARREASTEIHSILSVDASYADGEPALPLAPYHAFGQTLDAPPGGQWVARRVPAGRPGMGGTDIYLSFADLDQRSSKARLVQASTLCTNRELAGAIRPDPPGAGTFLVGESAGVLPVRCLYQPTRQHHPPLDGAQLWRLVSLLNLNQLSLEQLSAEPEAGSLQALRRLLELCNRTASAGAGSQIRAVQRMRCVSVVRPVRSGPAPGFRRGFEIELDLAPDTSYADGTPLMLAAVLQRFFCLYTPVNSFASVTVRQGELKVKEWAPAIAH